MNKKLTFISIFKDLIPKYIEYKQSLGFTYDYDYAKRLRGMDRFFHENYTLSQIILTKKMVIDFVKKRDNEANSTICSRCAVIRGFATFLINLGYKDIYFLPPEYIPKRTTNFIPHIFSTAQINMLFDIIDNYHFGSTYLNEHKIYSTLIRLLYSCGLRISEALSLKISELDFTNSIIHILKSKNNCSRIVCMSQSLSSVIQSYILDSKLSNDDLLFPSSNCGIYSQSSVSRMFRIFFKNANIYTSFGKLPRIHDFRHTFAVHSLRKMINNGMDIYCTLPFLSSFLGHKNIYSTEKYLKLVEDDFPNLTQNFNMIFPEVDNDDN